MVQAIERCEIVSKRDKLEYDAELAAWRRKNNKRGEPPVEPDEPWAQRYIVTDCTVQALAPILAQNPRGLLYARDELAGWLTSFNEFKGGKGSDVANWLEMHRGGPIIVDRKTNTRVIAVPRAAVSLTGTIQPSTLRRQLTPEFFDCGLAALLFLTMPPVAKKHWTEADISERTRERFADAVGRLLALQHDTDDDGEPVPADVTFTWEAKRAWVQWYGECAEHLSNARDDRMAAALAKIEGGAARLALVCQLIRDPVSVAIDEEAMRSGVELTRWFAQEAERIYTMWGAGQDECEQHALLELIESKGGVITARELQRARRCYSEAKKAKTALDGLVSAGFGRWAYVQPTAEDGSRRGKPTRVFQLVDAVDADKIGIFDSARAVIVSVNAVSARKSQVTHRCTDASAGGRGLAEKGER